MSISKRLIYMGLGAFLALSLFVGAFAAFAQSGTEGEEEATEPEVQTEEGATDEDAVQTPFNHRFFGRGGFDGADNGELLAEALGISVDELQAAYETAAQAAIQQALDEGLITEEQAEDLASRIEGFRGAFRLMNAGSIDFEALLADALGISVEELQEARMEAHAAKLAELVEAGALTQEEADMMLARQAIQSYVDTDAVSDAIQSAYESAIDEALADGAITEEQAQQLLDNAPSFGFRGFGLGGPDGRGHGRGGPGGNGFRGGPAGGFGSFAPSSQAPAVNGAAGA